MAVALSTLQSLLMTSHVIHNLPACLSTHHLGLLALFPFAIMQSGMSMHDYYIYGYAHTRKFLISV